MTIMTNKKEDILQAYQYRHATKEFDPAKKISEQDFNFILETGRLSPSSFGFEPWKFLVIQNETLRDKLLPVTWGGQKQLPTSSHFVIILSRTPKELLADSKHILRMMKDVQQLPEDVVIGKGGLYHKFLESDFDLLGNERAMFEWGCRQTYIALGNMMTAAAQIGIDSCPMEGFDKGKVEQILVEEGILDTNQFGISCMVAFGFRVKEPREKTRQTRSQIIQWVE
ncbi:MULTISPECIES: NAD(P)H-dependent oxidoreductase [Bacillus]|uniref:NAD(P)H nitroreductase YfkO n=2 Tax=Bacillus TaxID=1386 RepID=A0A0M4GC76_9BACI|nr:MULTISPECIES: NAD(P)H-dependent oxidoreductase [Bacillus]ALC83470.1 NAD(P)H nitroreductase YfkO [Bacillus gobiensis]MBP1082425.1 nitroreductase [Bacillus capparidis]MED1097324.1 NAD(P)H-dependent oxidoreductase [Bacillus capparidis]